MILFLFFFSSISLTKTTGQTTGHRLLRFSQQGRFPLHYSTEYLHRQEICFLFVSSPFTQRLLHHLNKFLIIFCFLKELQNLFNVFFRTTAGHFPMQRIDNLLLFFG